MKTQHAIQLAGSAKALAQLLEITGGAISQWGDDIPQQRVWQLRALKPEWFTATGEPIKDPTPEAEQGA